MSLSRTNLSRRDLGRLGAAAVTLAAAGTGGTIISRAQAQTRAPTTAPSGGTIKVGMLHSLSGTMAISETTLKDVMLMLIDEQNKKGGLLGKKLEAVVVDPASNWPLFAEKARAAHLASTNAPRCSAAGPRCRANRCCRSSRS